ncbi:MAG: cohesin domain-containing protein, partial [Armatimonadota bacterium]
MRRYLSLLVLGLLLAAAPVLAQGVVTVGNVSAQPGATVNIAVTVSDLPQIGGVSLGIRVQAPIGAPALQFGEAIRGTVFQGPKDVIATDLATPGQVQVVALSPEATAGPGTLFVLPVTVSAQAAPGTVYQLQVFKVEVVDAANNPVAVRAFGGTVAVTEAAAPVLSVANVTGAPGQTVSVPVNISAGVVGLGGASVTLSLVGLTAAGDAVRGPLFSGPNDVVATNILAPGVVQVVALSPTTVSGPGTIFSVPVAIPKTAKPGQVFPVVIREAELVDGANNPLAVIRQDGSVTVVSLAAATISVGITSAQPGSVAMIRVTANADVRDLAALRVTLDLGGGLTAVGDATLAGSLFVGPNDQIGTDRSNPSRPQVIIVTPGAVNGPGVLFSIPVQVPADAKPGTILPVQIVYAEALNSNNEPIEVIVQHGGVLVQAVDQFIRVDPREVLPGEVFPLSVSIGAGVTNLGGVRATLNLGGLTAVGDAVIEGTLFAGVPKTLIATSRVDAGRPQVILVSAGAVSGPGLVFTIPVKVPDTAVAGQEFLVLFEGLEAVDMNNQLIPLLVAPDSGRIRVKEQIPGIVSVVSVTGVNPGATVNLQIAANEQVKDLAAASFALDLGGLTATGNATLEGGIFAGIPNTQIGTDLSAPGAPRVVIVSPSAANGPGTVFTIPVKVPEGALPGTQFLIRLSIIEAINSLNQPLPLLARDGTVTVGLIPPPLPGLLIIRDASGAPGATIPLTVDIENLVNVGGARVNLNLGGLTAVGEATSALFSGPNDIVRTDLTNPGAPQVILLTPGGKNAPATLFTIPVQIPATATEGQKFTVTATVEFIDVANNPLAVNVQPGTVTVVGAPPVGVVKVRDMEADPDSV